jgi:MoxR-like ATPase
MKVCLTLDDFSIVNNRLDVLLKLKKHFPDFKVSLFTVPKDEKQDWGAYQIRRELSIEFFERDEVILDLMRAIAVGEHVLLLGPPGTAKSLLIRAFNSRVTGAKLFQWLLNRTSDPSEILGPLSIKAMERDEFKRQFTNKLPDCHFAFVDEIN